jgi:hypothetical protein
MDAYTARAKITDQDTARSGRQDKDSSVKPETLFEKTEKGREEIATRNHKLPPKLRALLFLVDGRRRVRDLRGASAGTESLIAELVSGGYIVPLTAPAPTAPRIRLVRSNPSPQPAATGLDLARSVAVRLLQEAIGRDADFAPRLARCLTSEDLLAHAERYAIVIGSVRNKNLGDAFLAQVRAALEAA